MINIFGLPKIARSCYGWMYDLWPTICRDIRNWRTIPIGEIDKLEALLYLCNRISQELNKEMPTEVSDIQTFLKTPKKARKSHRPFSPEMRKRMSDAQKARWARRKGVSL